MIKFCPLFSGSSGNCTYIEYEKNGVLLDCGVSMKKIVAELERIGRYPENLKAVFVTHEHIDHILSVGAIARKFKVPVYATQGTWRAMSSGVGIIDKQQIKFVEEGKPVVVGKLNITPFSIPHDAAQPVAYFFQSDGRKLAVATDIGRMNERIFMSLSGSDAVIIEANHDIRMLEGGNYPYKLKQRIMGEYGHISNDEAAAVCARLAALGTKTFFLGHISEENNTPAIALKTVIDSVSETCPTDGLKFGVLQRGRQGELITV